MTFLFTDIEGSTLLWDTRPDDMSRALARHDAILRSSIDLHGGVVFSTGGDGVAAAFQRASSAAEAAIAIQRALLAERWPEGMPIRVRIGLHTGEAEERDDDYFGACVNEAARVMSVGHGGQTVVSAATAALLRGADLTDLGMHRLKGVTGERRLHQLTASGLEADFPPVRSMGTRAGNLPAGVVDLVGRQDAVRAISELVGTHRLVTLTGAGGIGKTQLALHVARAVVTDNPGGAWIVDLAPVADASTVAQVVATTLNVVGTDETLLDSLVDRLSGERVLLLLDNCEHVLRAVTSLVESLLERTPTLKVLATSREGLGVSAEHLWPVPPLEVAGPRAPAVALFVERARQHAPDVVIESDDVRAVVADICQQLDGMPLAIELAAARMISMSAADIRDRLHHRFRLLAGPRRSLERHQTLRHAVSWSFDLLNDRERDVLASASVFANGFDLTGAVAVCGGEDEYDMLDNLDRLVAKSLVHVDRRGDAIRYGMLESIRQFAEELLASADRAASTRERHAMHVHRRLHEHVENFDSPKLRLALEYLDADFDNVRLAFEWASGHDELGVAAEIAAMATPLALCLHRFEPVAWAEELLPRAVAVDLPQLRDLYTAAAFCVQMGRPADGIAYAERALALGTRAPSLRVLGPSAALVLISAHAFTGATDLALAQARALMQEPEHRVQALSALLLWAAFGGQTEVATAVAEEALTAARESGWPFWLAQTLWGYGQTFAATDPDRAMAAYQEGIEHSHANRLAFFEAGLRREAAVLEHRSGNVRRALTMLEDGLLATHRAGDRNDMVITAAHLSTALHTLGRQADAAMVTGWVRQQPSTLPPTGYNTLLADLEGALGSDALMRYSRAGAEMNPSELVGFIRNVVDRELGR